MRQASSDKAILCGLAEALVGVLALAAILGGAVMLGVMAAPSVSSRIAQATHVAGPSLY